MIFAIIAVPAVAALILLPWVVFKLGLWKSSLVFLILAHTLTITSIDALRTAGVILRVPSVGILLLVAVYQFGKRERRQQDVRFNTPFLENSLAAFSVLTFVSLIWTVNILDTIAKSTFVVCMFLAFYLAARTRWLWDVRFIIEDVKTVFWTLSALAIVTYPLALFGLLNVTGVGNRFQGIYQNPNTLALATMFLPFLGIYLYQVSRQKRYLWIGLFSLIPLLQTGSHSALISIFGAGVIAFLLWTFRKLSIAQFSITAIAVLAVYAYVNFRSRILEAETPLLLVFRRAEMKIAGGGISNSRDELWGASFDLFLTRPVLGHGFNGTRTILNTVGQVGGLMQSHQSYLEVLLDLGVIGGLFLGCILLSLIPAVVRMSQTPRNNWLWMAVAASLIVSAVESSLFAMSSSFAWVTWMLIFMIIAYGHQLKRKEREAQLPIHELATISRE